jgi:hypothetical protein
MPGWVRRALGREQDESRRQPWSESTGQREPEPPSVEEKREPLPPHLRPGVIYISDYMSPEREAEVFEVGADGLPTGRLRRRAGRLVLVPDEAPDELVNPRSRRLYKLDLFCFKVRGVSYYDAAVIAGDFRPGQPVRLVREPDNPYGGGTAIAIHAVNGFKRAGYVNKQNARRLAKRIDAGEVFEGISVRGDGPGCWEEPVTVLVAYPDVMAYLLR